MKRFWDKVARGGAGECWEWIGCRKPKGYGYFRFEGRAQHAQRVAWTLTHGAIPEGMLVCHRCDNPPCVNPAHLFLGSAADNSRDMAEKGRGGATRKLTASWLRVAIALRGQGLSQRAIGGELGVSASSISHSLRGLSWRKHAHV